MELVLALLASVHAHAPPCVTFWDYMKHTDLAVIVYTGREAQEFFDALVFHDHQQPLWPIKVWAIIIQHSAVDFYVAPLFLSDGCAAGINANFSGETFKAVRASMGAAG